MTYKVLIIGCGAIAGGYDAERSPADWPLSHAGAIARSDDFELITCVDPDEAARKAFAERWNVPVAVASLDNLEADEGQYDLIVIASPTQCHAAHLDGALATKPRAVFCEKPVAGDLNGANRIAEQFGSSDTLLAVNYTRRWAPDLVEFATQIEAGSWGALVAAAGTYTKGIVHNGTHMIDLLHMLVGDLELHSVGPARPDFWADDPTASAILATKNGAPVHLVAGDANAHTQFELVLGFERGEIAMRDGGLRIETRRVADSDIVVGHRQLGVPDSIPGRYPEAMSRAYANIAGALHGDVPLASTSENALKAQRLCEEIRIKALKNMQKDPE